MRNKKMVTYLIGVLMTASMMNTAYGVEAAEPVQETAVKRQRVSLLRGSAMSMET